MPVEERERHELHARLEQVLGTEEAATLMSYLPPVGWADVATKRDLDNLANQLRIEMRDEFAELRGEFRTEMNGLRDELRGEMNGLRDGLRSEMNGLCDGLRGEMNDLRDSLNDKLDANLRVLVFSVIAAVFTTAGLAFGAASLG